jgi:hypothetical protein
MIIRGFSAVSAKAMPPFAAGALAAGVADVAGGVADVAGGVGAGAPLR